MSLACCEQEIQSCGDRGRTVAVRRLKHTRQADQCTGHNKRDRQRRSLPDTADMRRLTVLADGIHPQAGAGVLEE